MVSYGLLFMAGLTGLAVWLWWGAGLDRDEARLATADEAVGRKIAVENQDKAVANQKKAEAASKESLRQLSNASGGKAFRPETWNTIRCSRTIIFSGRPRRPRRPASPRG